MATRIRLQRHGKKRYAYYHIVVADQRSKRDGKSIERIGDYNPNTNPATINLDFSRALYWLQVGAQPSDTAKAILSYTGVMHKNHLLNGVKKGAFSEEEAEKRFESWMADKESRIQAKRDKLKQDIASAKADALAVEAKVNAERAKELAAKNSPVAEAVEGEAAEDVADAPVEETAEAGTELAEAVVEETAPAEEATPAEEAAPAAEAPVAESNEEPAAEAEEPTSETEESEAPAEEEAKEEEE